MAWPNGSCPRHRAIYARNRDHAGWPATCTISRSTCGRTLSIIRICLARSASVSGCEGVTWASMPIASMHFSGPLPLVSSLRRSTLSSSKLMVMAPRPPPCSGAQEMVDGHDLLRSEQDGAADRHLADGAATPDRPVSVGWMSHCTAACQPVGKMSPRKRSCSSGIPSGTLICVASANGTPLCYLIENLPFATGMLTPMWWDYPSPTRRRGPGLPVRLAALTSLEVAPTTQAPRCLSH